MSLDKNQKAATTLLLDEIGKKHDFLPNLLRHVSPETLAQSVDAALHRFCLKCVMRHGFLACASFAVACVWQNDFTFRERNKDVELDARTNPVLFHKLFRLGLEARHNSVRERPSFPQLDFPDFSGKPSKWNSSNECHRCLRLCP